MSRQHGRVRIGLREERFFTEPSGWKVGMHGFCKKDPRSGYRLAIFSLQTADLIRWAAMFSTSADAQNAFAHVPKHLKTALPAEHRSFIKGFKSFRIDGVSVRADTTSRKFYVEHTDEPGKTVCAKLSVWAAIANLILRDEATHEDPEFASAFNPNLPAGDIDLELQALVLNTAEAKTETTPVVPAPPAAKAPEPKPAEKPQPTRAERLLARLLELQVEIEDETSGELPADIIARLKALGPMAAKTAELLAKSGIKPAPILSQASDDLEERVKLVSAEVVKLSMTKRNELLALQKQVETARADLAAKETELQELAARSEEVLRNTIEGLAAELETQLKPVFAPKAPAPQKAAQ